MAALVGSDLMKRDVVTCREHDPVRECARLMFEYNMGLLPVTDVDGKVVGVVTDRDLVTRIMADPLRDDATPVHRVMSTPPVTCTPEDDFATIVETMAVAKSSRLIVVNGTGRCLGLIGLFEIGLIDPDLAGALLKSITQPEGSIAVAGRK